MVETRNGAAVRAAFEALGQGDRRPLAQLFAEDIVARHVSMGRFSGEVRGRQAYLEHLTALVRGAGGRLTVRLPLVYGAGPELVVVHVRTAGSAGGDDRNAVLVYRLHEGRIVETWELGDSALDTVLA